MRSVKVGGFGGCLEIGDGVYTGLISGCSGWFFGSGCVGEARGGLGRFPVRLVGFNVARLALRAVLVKKHARTL